MTECSWIIFMGHGTDQSAPVSTCHFGCCFGCCGVCQNSRSSLVVTCATSMNAKLSGFFSLHAVAALVSCDLQTAVPSDKRDHMILTLLYTRFALVAL